MNGVLLLIPWSVLDRPAAADRYARRLALSLVVVREMTGVSCPVAVAVTGLEGDPGFGPIAAGLPETEPYRLGASVPWQLRPDRKQVRGVVADCIERFIAALTYQACEHLRREYQDPERAESVLLDVERLVGFVLRLHDYRPALHRCLARIADAACGGDPGGWCLWSGCYAVGAGPRSVDQVFLPGVLARLNEDRCHLAWTAEAYRADAACHRLARRGNLALVILACALVALVWLLLPA